MSAIVVSSSLREIFMPSPNVDGQSFILKPNSLSEHPRRVGYSVFLGISIEIMTPLPKLWNVENGELLKEFPGHNAVIKKILMPNELTIITGTSGDDHAIRIWDVASGSCLHRLDNHTGTILKLALVGDRLFSSATDETVRIWDSKTGSELHRLEGHTKSALFLGFNDEKTLLAAACSGGPIKIWRIDHGTPVANCEGHTWVANQFANHSGCLVSASADGSIRIWRWENGSLLQANEQHPPVENKSNALRGMVWTNRYLITGGFRDGTLKVWDKESSTFISEYVVSECIGHVVRGEGKLAVASIVESRLHQITLWDTSSIDTEGL